MECHLALELLESSRPDSTDLQEPELADAATHMEHCPECEKTFRNWQALDRKIATAMRDVPLPEDLSQRLLESPAQKAAGSDQLHWDPARHVIVENETGAASENKTHPSENAISSDARSVQPLRRNRFQIGAGLSAVCLLVIAVGCYLFFASPRPELELADINRDVPLSIEQIEILDPFDKNFEAQLPEYGWNGNSLLRFAAVRGFGNSKEGEHQLAVVPFRFPGRGGSELQGVLVIAPTSMVEPNGLPANFSPAKVRYITRTEGEYAWAAWTANDRVYICFVPGDGDALDRLARILGGNPA